MIVELANGKEVISRNAVGNLNFKLGENPTSVFFRTLPIGMYDGILGMDWLSANRASIHCANGTVTFRNNQDQEMLVQGKNSAPKARLVKANRLIKGVNKSGKQIYVFKLNRC